MRLIYRIIIVALFISWGQKTNAQDFQLGASFSGFNYLGDMVAGPIYLPETNIGFGVFGKYFINNRFGVKAAYYSGKITGNDSNFSERQDRGFSFSSDLSELSLTIEMHPLGLSRYNNIGDFARSISPYIFIGVSYVSVDPMVSGLDKIPSPPEINEDFKDSKFSIPIGIGVQANVFENIAVALDIGMRPIFDDKLDGLYLSGNPEKNDWYAIGSFSISYIFGNDPKFFR